jgi:hypothetical protein
MFDANDQNQQVQNTSVMPEPANDAVQPPAVDATAPVVTADPVSNSTNGAPTVAEPIQFSTPEPAVEAVAESTPSFDSAPQSVVAEPSPEPVAVETPAAATPATDDLMSIKKDALQHLSPLLSHLDQTPEEKFRTTMMLIQASDDQSLVQTAYAAAKDIEDEKVRAQALLDIVNEINYFTQQKPAATV